MSTNLFATYNAAVEAIGPRVDRVTHWEYLLTCDPRYLPREHRLRPPPPMASPEVHARHRERIARRTARWTRAYWEAVAEYEVARAALTVARRALERSGISLEPRWDVHADPTPERKPEPQRAVVIDTVRKHLRANGDPGGWKRQRFESKIRSCSTES